MLLIKAGKAQRHRLREVCAASLPTTRNRWMLAQQSGCWKIVPVPRDRNSGE